MAHHGDVDGEARGKWMQGSEKDPNEIISELCAEKESLRSEVERLQKANDEHVDHAVWFAREITRLTVALNSVKVFVDDRKLVLKTVDEALKGGMVNPLAEVMPVVDSGTLLQSYARTMKVYRDTLEQIRREVYNGDLDHRRARLISLIDIGLKGGVDGGS